LSPRLLHLPGSGDGALASARVKKSTTEALRYLERPLF